MSLRVALCVMFMENSFANFSWHYTTRWELLSIAFHTSSTHRELTSARKTIMINCY